MSATNIEWTDFTWNPVRGCNRKSKGCINCYAEHQAARIVRMDRGRGIPEGQGAYDGLVEMTSQGPKWTGKISEVWDALDTPLRMKKPRRIFVNSMSDLFHDGVSDEFIAEVLAHAAYARQHTFQILTKCPERMQKLLTSDAFMELYEDACSGVRVEAEEILTRRGEFSVHHRLTTDIRAMNPAWPRPNIQLGVSAEDHDTASERIPLLLMTPAAVRFASLEPLIGEIALCDLRHPEGNDPIDALWHPDKAFFAHMRLAAKLDWVIVGGESGSKARPMHVEWARKIRNSCEATHTRFFFKQWGEWLPGHHYTPELQDRDSDLVQSRYECAQWDGEDWVIDRVMTMDQWDDDALWRVGKKAAGRLLDGREHNEFPAGVCA